MTSLYFCAAVDVFVIASVSDIIISQKYKAHVSFPTGKWNIPLKKLNRFLSLVNIEILIITTVLFSLLKKIKILRILF